VTPDRSCPLRPGGPPCVRRRRVRWRCARRPLARHSCLSGAAGPGWG
jgi:hypothetical protein